MTNPISRTRLDIPSEIYEEALKMMKTLPRRGKNKLSDNARLAAMAGYVLGALNERNGVHKNCE